MREMNSIVAVYEMPPGAIEGVNDLQKAGFNMMNLSLAAKESHGENQIAGYYSAGDHIKYWGEMGAFWNGVGPCLSTAAFALLPGIGPVLMTGPLVAGFASGMEEVSDPHGVGAFAVGLSRLGIPADSVVRYESALCAGKLLLVALGAPDELLSAKATLHKTRPEEVNVHFTEKVALARR